MAELILALLAGAGVGALAYGLRLRLTFGGLRAEATRLRSEAQREGERIVREAELKGQAETLERERAQARTLTSQRDALAQSERQLRQREAELARRSDALTRREGELRARDEGLAAGEAAGHLKLKDAEAKLALAAQELARVATLSREEARRELLESLRGEARRAAAGEVRRIEEEARREAAERAKGIIATAIQRFAGDFVSEKTVSVVELPSDDMKGRIIGREGRNIRVFEAVTGVDVIIDDTPEVVVVSAFNPVRREIAKRALEKLVADGRIHPARIEEVVAKAKEEIEQVVERAGEQAAFDLGLHGLHPDLLGLVGKLRFRTAGGYNLWNHVVETAAIAGMMASEMGVNAILAKRAGLLHDIGHAVEHQVEGSHAQAGAEVARRCGEKPPVVDAIRAHHDADPENVLAILVQAADRLSKARPGARRDVVEAYTKRLEDLERLSMSFKGVEKAYAIQSGREIRVMVDFGAISDDETLLLAQDIARRIEDEMTHAGEVRVTVIREARVTEIAR